MILGRQPGDSALTAPSSSSQCPKCRTRVTADARFCVACGTALAPTEPSGQSMAMGPADAMDPASSGFIGREVAGRYRILAKLGDGGMGAVYRAEQISLKRIVALKVLRPELSVEPGMVRRFNAEAELAAKLSHPNTVTLFDFGQDADGALFIAMEYLEGRSLRDVLTREGPLAPGRALAICEQVCASLADAHAHGIVHRDLKPDNVMLAQRGRQADVVRVVDFGIAKLRDEQGDVTARPMTRAGDLLGTPQYMAPEQIRGETVDARTDVYALGAMLYEMVTGRLPFEGPSLMAILSKHLTEMPMPPRDRRPDLRMSPALSQLIMDALQKDPAQRPPTMDAFADRLARLVLEVQPPTDVSIPYGAPGTGVGYPPVPALPDNPPPGVPLLRTPPPGSVLSPVPGALVRPYGAELGPREAEFGPREGYASPPPYVSPPPVPPGYGALPSPAPAGPPGPMGVPPAHGYMSPPPGPAPVHPQGSAPMPMPTAASAGRGGMWIVLGVLAAGGAAAAVFFAARASGSDSPGGDGPDGPGGIPTSPSGSAVSADFQIQPERQLYGGDEGDSPPPPPGSPPPASPGHAEPGVAVWEGGWWKDSSGALELDIPRGFSVGAGGLGGAMFAGHCGGAPCTIQTISSSTYGMQVDSAMLSQVVSQLPAAGTGQPGSVSAVRVQGRDHYSVVVDDPAQGLRGQMVVFHGSSALAIVLIQAQTTAFDQTADFRKGFFARRVRLPGR
jgi:serine/threonine protein kinase